MRKSVGHIGLVTISWWSELQNWQVVTPVATYRKVVAKPIKPTDLRTV